MVLTGDQIEQLGQLVEEALPLDRDARKRWLRNLSPEYRPLVPALRQALLSDDPRSSLALLAQLPTLGTSSKAATVTASGLRAGQRIGPYQLIRELGAGGMAVVWLARAQVDSARAVALKLPLLSRLRRDLAGRFERECLILSQLEHPNIARMYDAGVSEDGLPYLALEYVEGKPLTSWCDEHRMGLHERLELFLQVLDAVQYAHGRQVVHRDLKPSNLLVTDWGQVRLLDFGVAKMLADGGDVVRTDLTQLYGRMLTPDYASPEQLKGGAISPASDIYALGIVLYELLVGDRPYRIKPASAPALLEHALKDAQVRKPSTQVQSTAAVARATTRDKLARRLRGDVDAMVLKALARHPRDRYGSARSFADDVRRYLAGAPVEAGSDRLHARFGRLLERHPFATATVVTLIAGSIELAVQYRSEWVPAVQPAMQQLAAHAAAAFQRWRPDESSKRPH
ncbi:MAG TPA: serine/threonine-protein kinase [Burkholderiaceae bacterium]|jgi:serine/threonine-protein kinase|nr:serine/threonine-protein kinase [Burkholderiaceae bacterium]